MPTTESAGPDVRPEWYNIIRRLDSASRAKNIGIAEMTMNVFIDGNGNPVVWTEPRKRNQWLSVPPHDPELERRLPADIRPRWWTLMKLVQVQALRRSTAMSVMRLVILVDARGNPVIWSEPLIMPVEPKRMAESFMSLLTGDA